MRLNTILHTYLNIALTIISLAIGGGDLRAAGGNAVNPVSRMSALQELLSQEPEHIGALTEAANIYYDMNDLEGCTRIAQRLENVAYKYPDSTRALFQAKLLQGRISTRSGNGDDALRHLNQALTIAETGSMTREKAEAHNALGKCYINLYENYTAGINHYNDALENARTYGSRPLIAATLRNLAETYLWCNIFTGREFAEEGLKLAIESDDIEGIARNTLCIAGYDAWNKSKFTETMQLIDQVRQYNRLYGFPSEEEIALVEGKALYMVQQHAAATEILKAAATGILPGAITPLRVKAMLLLGSNYCSAGDYKNSIEAYRQGIALSDSVHYREVTPQLYSGLAYSLAHAGLYKEAYEYERAYSRHADSLSMEETASNMAESRVRNEIMLSQLRLERQRVELAQRDTRVMLLAAVAFISLLLIISLALAYRRQRRHYRTIVEREEEARARERLLRAALEQAREDAAASADDDEAKNRPRPLDDDKVEQLMVKFNELMTESKAYADPTLSIKNVAEALDTNRTYLSQAINRTFGKSFPLVLAEYRVRAAIEMMSTTDLPLKAIAADAGFSSTSTFYSAFREITGMPPSKYRENLFNP